MAETLNILCLARLGIHVTSYVATCSTLIRVLFCQYTAIIIAMTIATLILLDHIICPTLLVNKPCDRTAIEFNEASCSPPPSLPVESLGRGGALGGETVLKIPAYQH